MLISTEIPVPATILTVETQQHSIHVMRHQLHFLHFPHTSTVKVDLASRDISVFRCRIAAIYSHINYNRTICTENIHLLEV